jgi:hypothetical protein
VHHGADAVAPVVRPVANVLVPRRISVVSFAMFHVIEPLTLILLDNGEPWNTLAVIFAGLLVSIGSSAVPLVIFEIADIFGAVAVYLDAFAFAKAVVVEPSMRASVLPNGSAFVMRFIVVEIAFVYRPLRVDIDASALSDLSSPDEFSFIMKTVPRQKLCPISNISCPLIMVLVVINVGTQSDPRFLQAYRP